MDDVVFFHAAAIRGFSGDAAGDSCANTVAVRGAQVVDAGPFDVLRRKHGTPREVKALPGMLLLPGFINAHAHLELTAIGPQPYGGDFSDWVMMLRNHWPGDGPVWDKQPDLAWFAEASAAGACAAFAAGVQAVGDIARFDASAEARRGAGLEGVTFIELFGLGPPHDADALERVTQRADGFQPHAPYSAGPVVYEAAAATGLPLTTHLAETLDEAQFVAQASGAFRELLERVGKWLPGFAGAYQEDASPVAWMAPHLRRDRWLLAHCNYVNDADIALLSETHASVAYCPIASDYFGHRDHRYRDMLAAGVNVCLGTDSVVCQPGDGDPTQWLSLLPQMRHLYRRDGVDPAQLLEMATARGCAALNPQGDGGHAITRLVAIEIDAGLAIDPLVQVMRSDLPGRGVGAMSR
ncbi:MAG: amidohydrolase family protein [Algisphaera sp.]